MKRQFEDIDDLFLSKINNLDDFDVEINEHLIWKDIENQLNKKKSVRILWWQYASAACVSLLLGLGYFKYNIKEISTNDLATKIPVQKQENILRNTVSNDLILKDKLIDKTNQIADNQLIIDRKNNVLISEKVAKNHNFNLKNFTPIYKNLSMIEPLHSINIQKTEIAFNLTEIKNVEVSLPKKLRVMHIEDFQIQPIDRINQPKVFYVFFNKEFNIDNQLPTVSITHPNNVN